MTIDPRTEPVNWETVNNALFRWIVDTLELPDEQVVWANQNLDNQPAYPYVTMLRTAITIDGGGSAERRHTYDPAQPLGKEIQQTINRQYAFNLEIQTFNNEENGKLDPLCDAMYMASRLLNSIDLESVCADFAVAGLAVIGEEAIQDISTIVNRKFDSRASLDIRFRIAAVTSERIGYIDKAELEKTDDPAFTLLVDAS